MPKYDLTAKVKFANTAEAMAEFASLAEVYPSTWMPESEDGLSMHMTVNGAVLDVRLRVDSKKLRDDHATRLKNKGIGGNVDTHTCEHDRGGACTDPLCTKWGVQDEPS